MIRRIQGRLSYANVVSTLALVLVIGGGTAVALSGNASTVNGVTVQKIDFKANGDTKTTKILSAGDLTLKALCKGSQLELFASTSVNNAELQSFGNQADTQLNDFDSGTKVGIYTTANPEERTLVYRPPSGPTVAVDYLASDTSPLGGTAECVVSGFAEYK